ncbi:MAG: response regulator [Bacteroidota bacterium]
MHSNFKILIVEDNLMNQKLVGYMLSDWGYEFEACNNGKQAIEKIQQTAYQLILMDIQMPEMDGYETTVYLREKLLLNITIIAMTAQTSNDEKNKCLSLGMTDYISKPIQEAELESLIAKYNLPVA